MCTSPWKSQCGFEAHISKKSHQVQCTRLHGQLSILRVKCLNEKVDSVLMYTFLWKTWYRPDILRFMDTSSLAHYCYISFPANSATTRMMASSIDLDFTVPELSQQTVLPPGVWYHRFQQGLFVGFAHHAESDFGVWICYHSGMSS